MYVSLAPSISIARRFTMKRKNVDWKDVVRKMKQLGIDGFSKKFEPKDHMAHLRKMERIRKRRAKATKKHRR